MEFFKYASVDGQTILESGQPINGAKRFLWVEKYAEPGEFTIEAPLNSDLRRFLPLGTLISHMNTNEIMMVENHEITENLGEDSTIAITGRSFWAYLENRIIGMNAARSSSAVDPTLTLASALSWNQIVTLINAYVQTPTDSDDALPNVFADTSITGTGTSEVRKIDRGKDVLAEVLELLDVDNTGLRCAPFGTSVMLEVYKGIDRRKDVIFSWTGKDLSASGYLFTNKKIKNSALVQGKWVWTIVDTAGIVGYDRRMMFVDAQDIDDQLTAMPTGGPLATYISRMQTRGRQKLKKQKDINITNADISNLSNYEYRHHYNVGDLVTIEGDFSISGAGSEVKRITEYAEAQDETGYSGHPTLSLPFDE